MHHLNTLLPRLFLPALLAVSALPCAVGIGAPLFKRHFIADDIPQAKSLPWGYGTPALADFDCDGRQDYAFSTREEKVYWFASEAGGTWQRFEVGPIATGQLGATVAHVDGDTWPDLLVGGFWYRNSGKPRTEHFARHCYDNRIASEIHDIAMADIDGNGRADLVVLGDKAGCFWYEIPANPMKDENWPRHLITDAVLKTKDSIHGGFFPKGLGDLNGDGAIDLVLPDRWLENRDHGQAWRAHFLPFGKRGPWGLSSRSWIVDLDRDGDPDIVVVDCDQKESRAAWLENLGGKTPQFSAHFLPIAASGKRGSFHSLAVADFDLDGDLDILTAEQEDPSILPEGARPRWYLWENRGGKRPEFVERVVLDCGLGGHDLLVGDIDGDGDLDVVSKIWKRWPANANQGRFHADWLENQTRNPGAGKAP